MTLFLWFAVPMVTLVVGFMLGHKIGHRSGRIEGCAECATAAHAYYQPLIDYLAGNYGELLVKHQKLERAVDEGETWKLTGE